MGRHSGQRISGHPLLVRVGVDGRHLLTDGAALRLTAFLVVAVAVIVIGRAAGAATAAVGVVEAAVEMGLELQNSSAPAPIAELLMCGMEASSN